MKNKRLTGFVIAIVIGLALGLVYGWFINPPAPRNTSLESLRGDYQADYVLMVAERYAVDQDGLSAAASLRQIAPTNPADAVRQARILGQQLGYSERELQDLAVLESALSTVGTISTEAAP